MTCDIERSYAGVIVRSAVNVQKNQPVRISTEVVNSGFARTLAKEAYAAGASFVEVVYVDAPLERIRLDSTLDESCLEYVPSWLPGTYETLLEQNWAAIALRGSEDPDILEGSDAGRVGILRKALAVSREAFSDGISSNRIAWNVCLWPTVLWARKVLGEDHPDWEKRIWDILTPILRLDHDDPAVAWTEHDGELKRRAGCLNGKKYERIHLTGPGTDLNVRLKPDRIWVGGSCLNRAGTRFFPNIPTEEIFSTPDRSGTYGTVRCTRPVTVLGTQVEGAWFHFENGAVVESGARKNADVLDKFLETEDSARYAGEIALVGTDSPVYRSGHVFHNILLDENAACHIALGNGYKDCIEDGTVMQKQELKAVGCNVSLVHIDFMIGSEEVSVSGVDHSGRAEPIIENGRFVI